MNKISIDKLRQIFKDPTASLTLQIVRINKIEVAMDGSSYQAECETLPDEYEFLATITQNENLEGGVAEGQLWLAGLVGNDLNNGFLIRKINNDKSKLHPKAKEGGTVLSSQPGKNVYVSNNHDAVLHQAGILGPELVKWLLKLSSEVKGIADKVNSLKNWATTHAHPTAAIGPASPPIVPPTTTATPEKTAITQLEAKTETDKFLSDLFFIQEKGKNNPS